MNKKLLITVITVALGFSSPVIENGAGILVFDLGEHDINNWRITVSNYARIGDPISHNDNWKPTAAPFEGAGLCSPNHRRKLVSL